MEIRVQHFENAAAFFAAAGEFLLARPVHHNLILSIVDARLNQTESGHYWVAFRGHEAVGVALQSPLTFPATLVPMEPDITAAIVDAIADAGILLPGVNGDAATAAAFAGQWTERSKSGAVPTQGQRLYELVELNQLPPVEGSLKQADPSHRDLALEWLRAFLAETQTPDNGAERLIDTSLASGLLWFWQTDNPVSMAIRRKPIQGVVRVSAVYTPPENRKHGYAAACVHAVSKALIETGYRCVLYTDLGNPTSNSIYRQIGYRAVAETIHYRFDYS